MCRTRRRGGAAKDAAADAIHAATPPEGLAPGLAPLDRRGGGGASGSQHPAKGAPEFGGPVTLVPPAVRDDHPFRVPGQHAEHRLPQLAFAIH